MFKHIQDGVSGLGFVDDQMYILPAKSYKLKFKNKDVTISPARFYRADTELGMNILRCKIPKSIFHRSYLEQVTTAINKKDQKGPSEISNHMKPGTDCVIEENIIHT